MTEKCSTPVIEALAAIFYMGLDEIASLSPQEVEELLREANIRIVEKA